MSQVKTLYAEFSDVKKPTTDTKKGKENDIKKQQQKKPQQQQQQQKTEKPKEGKPKTLDAAINRVRSWTPFFVMGASIYLISTQVYFAFSFFTDKCARIPEYDCFGPSQV